MGGSALWLKDVVFKTERQFPPPIAKKLMGSKFKIFYVLVRNKMPTVLPPLAPFQKISWLMAWINYLWGCYQALMGNYQLLQAENAKLQAEKAKMQTENAMMRLQNACLLSQLQTKDEQRRTESHKNCLMKETIRGLMKEAAFQRRIASTAEQRLTCAEEDAAYWQCCAEQAEQDLCAREQQEAAEAAILFELGNDASWTSVSKGNFVKSQTKAVLKAQNKTAQKQAELDEIKSSIAKLAESLPFDAVTQSPVTCPVIVVPSLSTLDAKIVNKGSAMNLKNVMGGKFPTGHGATIQGTYECADVKTMYEGIFKLLKLCGHNLDE